MRRIHLGVIRAGAVMLLLSSCSGSASDATPALPPSLLRPSISNANATPPAVPFDSSTPRMVAQALSSWPHDTGAYTQGLVVDHGRLLEGTGLEGQSELREVERTSGRVQRRLALPAMDFGEGIATIGDTVYQLTWRGGHGYRYRLDSLVRLNSFSYDGEGWGLAGDGHRLYLSDGTHRIRVLSPAGMVVERVIEVQEAGRNVWMLNELEWVDGELWANVYQTDWIARIDPTTGRIVGWVDVSRLLTDAERANVRERGGVANGIAYDGGTRQLLITGKRWPRLFAIALPTRANR